MRARAMIRISRNSISNNGIRVRAICGRSVGVTRRLAKSESRVRIPSTALPRLIGVVDGYGDRSGCNPDVLATKAVRFRPAPLIAFFENRIVAAKKRNAGSRVHGEPASRVRRLMAGQRILNPSLEGSIPSAPTSAVVARVAEQRTFNPLGTGSSPVDGTRVMRDWPSGRGTGPPNRRDGFDSHIPHFEYSGVV